MKNKVQRAASLLLAMILAVAFSMPTFAAKTFRVWKKKKA